MEVDFFDAVNGATTKVSLPAGPALEVQIPASTRDGQTHYGARATLVSGRSCRRRTDRYPTRFFTRDGDDIRLDLLVTLSEVVLGGKVRVPTPSGPGNVVLPPNSSSGKVSRIRERVWMI